MGWFDRYLPANFFVQVLSCGTVGGATAATVVLFAVNAADAGDVLGFVGAVVGAAVGTGLAVAGAGWQDELKREKAQAEVTETQIAIIDQFTRSVSFPDDLTHARASGHILTVLQYYQLVLETLLASPPKGAPARGLLATLRHWRDFDIATLKKISDEVISESITVETAVAQARTAMVMNLELSGELRKILVTGKMSDISDKRVRA